MDTTPKLAEDYGPIFKSLNPALRERIRGFYEFDRGVEWVETMEGFAAVLGTNVKRAREIMSGNDRVGSFAFVKGLDPSGPHSGHRAHLRDLLAVRDVLKGLGSA